MAAGNLTPNLINPRELVALGTYSLNTLTPTNLCPQFPAAALNAMGSGDAFISILGSEPSPAFPTHKRTRSQLVPREGSTGHPATICLGQIFRSALPIH